MRPDDEPDAVAPAPQTEKVIEPPAGSRGQAGQGSKPYAGMALDWQASVRQYMLKKGKA
jgi:hypothetical protein